MAALEERPGAPRGGDSPKVVLVAEDDDDIRELIATCLTQGGYSVVTARDGEEALAVAAQIYPDCAVLDMSMPKVDGYSIARRLREHRVLGRMGIVAVTALGSEQDVLAGFEAGMDDYVTKPFNPSELRARVDALMTRR